MGLGNGIVFDLGTVITMLIVCVVVGAFILYSVFKYSEEELGSLYEKLGIPPKKEVEEVEIQQEEVTVESGREESIDNVDKE